MQLLQILNDLLAGAPGARSAVLADWEGEAVVVAARNGDREYDIKVIGAHHGIILALARQMLTRLGLGEASDLTFVHDKFQVITAPVNREYYVVLTLDPAALPALARPALQDAIVALEKEIN